MIVVKVNIEMMIYDDYSWFDNQDILATFMVVTVHAVSNVIKMETF